MIRYNVGGIFTLFLLLSGIVLTVITIRRMKTGQIDLPGWAKVLLSAAMILSLLITFISLLPPMEVTVDNPFISEDTYIVAPADPDGSEVKIPD